MRFVLAIVSFVLAAVLIGFGIAQRTILAEPDEVALSVATTGNAPVTVISGDALNTFDGSQTLTISGADTVFAGYGRTTDVIAWIGDASYNLVTLDEENGELVSEVVRGSETEVPDPNGSDLWLDDFVKTDELTLTVNVPQEVSFIIAADGIEAAPADLTVSWPLDNSTPWSGPLIVGGAVALLLGLGFLLWATNHMRSSRGPRRKPQKMPKVPRKRGIKRGGRKAVEPAARRALVAVPILLVGSLALSGCSPDFWPSSGAGSNPTPTATAPAASLLDPPAVTIRQVERIIAKIGVVATKADAERNVDLISTRFAGPALEARLANYTIRGNDPSITEMPTSIPTGKATYIVPQQTDGWPRTVLAVVQDDKDATIPPVALFLVQDDPRSDYHVNYAITLEPSAVLPDVAPASVGASRLPTDTAVLKYTPEEVALAYGEILEKDAESSSYLDFQVEDDSLREAVGLAAKQALQAALPSTAAMSFSHSLGAGDPIALATNDAGALVAVNLYEMTTVKPVEAGAAVNPTGQVKALSGSAISTKGIIATYSDQLLFYVPPAGSGAKIVLLGYSQGLVTATEAG